jgi:hypothetical protein
MVDVTLTCLDEHQPQDVFVAMRVGDVQKLGRLSSERFYSFPKSGEYKYGKLEIFRRVSQATVPVTPGDGDHIVCTSLGEGKMNFRLSYAPQKPVKEKPLKPKLEKARAYMRRHNLEARLKQAMSEIMNELPDDPIDFIAKSLRESDGSVTHIPAKPKDSGYAQALPENLAVGQRIVSLIAHDGGSFGKVQEGDVGIITGPCTRADLQDRSERVIADFPNSKQLPILISQFNTEAQDKAPPVGDEIIYKLEKALPANAAAATDTTAHTANKAPSPPEKPEAEIEVEDDGQAKSVPANTAQSEAPSPPEKPEAEIEVEDDGQAKSVPANTAQSEMLRENEELDPERARILAKQKLVDAASSGKLDEFLTKHSENASDVEKLRLQAKECLINATSSGKLHDTLTNVKRAETPKLEPEAEPLAKVQASMPDPDAEAFSQERTPSKKSRPSRQLTPLPSAAASRQVSQGAGQVSEPSRPGSGSNFAKKLAEAAIDGRLEQNVKDLHEAEIAAPAPIEDASVAEVEAYDRVDYGFDGDGWVLKETKVPSNVQNLDELAVWIKAQVPGAWGFTAHPEFPRKQYASAIEKEGTHSSADNSWPLYKFSKAQIYVWSQMATSLPEDWREELDYPKAGQEVTESELSKISEVCDVSVLLDAGYVVTEGEGTVQPRAKEKSATDTLFNAADTNHDGSLDQAELSTAIASGNLQVLTTQDVLNSLTGQMTDIIHSSVQSSMDTTFSQMMSTLKSELAERDTKTEELSNNVSELAYRVEAMQNTIDDNFAVG